MRAADGFDEGFRGLRGEAFRGTLGNPFVRIAAKHRENLDVIGGSQVRGARAHCNFAFQSGASVTQVFQDFRAERFHSVPASNLSESASLYRKLGPPRAASSPARSMPARPP